MALHLADAHRRMQRFTDPVLPLQSETKAAPLHTPRMQAPTVPSVEAVHNKPPTAEQKLTALVALSWAARRYRGSDLEPDRASNAATMPSSEDATKVVGDDGDHAMASRSACMAQVSPCSCAPLTSACSPRLEIHAKLDVHAHCRAACLVGLSAGQACVCIF